MPNLTTTDQLTVTQEADTYAAPAHGWTCFHCGETFTTPGAARNHFGFEPSADPACRIKLGAERGLVMALRKAEAAIEEMRRLLHNETCEAYRLYASQQTRHRAQIMATEEEGYERGLADGRQTTRSLPADVVRLVIAAREAWPLLDHGTDEERELDKALELFSCRVPYDGEPDDLDMSGDAR